MAGAPARRRARTFLTFSMLACVQALAQERPDVSREIEKRAGHPIAAAPRRLQTRIPSGVSLADGLSEEEAVALALWNNPALDRDLASLGLARADLIEAGLLRNPILSLLFPIGPKQLEVTATWPVEALWQRKRRVAAARADLQAVAQNLVQHGLDLVRDVRVAFADYQASAERAQLALETARNRRRLADLVGRRLRAGDVSALEEGAVRTEAERAEQQAALEPFALQAAKERLRTLAGLAEDDVKIEPLQPRQPPAAAAPPDRGSGEVGARRAPGPARRRDRGRSRGEPRRVGAVEGLHPLGDPRRQRRRERGLRDGPRLPGRDPDLRPKPGGTRASASADGAGGAELPGDSAAHRSRGAGSPHPSGAAAGRAGAPARHYRPCDGKDRRADREN